LRSLNRGFPQKNRRRRIGASANGNESRLRGGRLCFLDIFLDTFLHKPISCHLNGVVLGAIHLGHSVPLAILARYKELSLGTNFGRWNLPRLLKSRIEHPLSVCRSRAVCAA
jgi:hypothetical protein